MEGFAYNTRTKRLVKIGGQAYLLAKANGELGEPPKPEEKVLNPTQVGNAQPKAKKTLSDEQKAKMREGQKRWQEENKAAKARALAAAKEEMAMAKAQARRAKRVPQASSETFNLKIETP